MLSSDLIVFNRISRNEEGETGGGWLENQAHKPQTEHSEGDFEFFKFAIL